MYFFTKIPILGWSWAMAEYIFIKRVWESDLKVLKKDLNTICDYPKELFYSVSFYIYMP